MVMPHFVFLSSVNTHLHCFHFLATLNNVAVSIHVQVFVWAYIFNSCMYISRSYIFLSYHMVTIFDLLRNCQTVFDEPYTFSVVTAMHRSSSLSTSLTLVFLIVAIIVSIKWHPVVLLMMLSIFLCILPICISLEKLSIQNLC